MRQNNNNTAGAQCAGAWVGLIVMGTTLLLIEIALAHLPLLLSSPHLHFF